MLPTWLRRLLGILALGGGATGIAVTLQVMMLNVGVAAWLMSMPFLAYYAYGVACGLLLIEAGEDSLGANQWYWLLQVPVFQAKLLQFSLSSGLSLYLWCGLDHARIGFNGMVGSAWHFAFLQAPETPLVGFNAVALAAFLTLWRLRRTSGASFGAPILPATD